MNQINNFNDIFKTSFLEKVTTFSLLDTVIALGLAFALGLFIVLVYKKTFRGVMYSSTFSISLLFMTLITTMIIMAITSNVILSLGMVGALSIVRFRTAVKDPIDIAFLFWAISSGIVLGAGLIPLAVSGSLFIGIIMLVFMNRKSTDNPYLLVVNCRDEVSEKNIMDHIGKSVKKHVIKSKTVAEASGIELTVEIRLKDMCTDFVNEISRVAGVSNAVLVSYNGEYMS